MNARLRTLGRYFGLPRLTFTLDRRSQQRVVWASFLPMIVLSALLIQVALDFAFSPGFSSRIPEAWRRLRDLAFAVHSFGLPLAVAVFFAAGIQRWSRAEASWMLLIGAALTVAALGLGLASSMMIATQDSRDLFYKWRPHLWNSMASTFAFLAIGYFFIAYRGGAAAFGRPSPSRRRRRPRVEA